MAIHVIDCLWMCVLCLMTLFSFSHSSVVIDGGVGSTSVSLLRYDGDLASLVASLEAKVNKLATWSEDHPFVRELVKRIEKLELVTAQQAEKISVLELKPAQQLETETQDLNSTIAEHGRELAKAKEKLEKLEKDVATKTLEIDNELVVNLSDYKGGRLMVKTSHGRILAFQPVNSDSLEDALKFIKIFNAKDGTRLALGGNETLSPSFLHSDAAYKTFYANSNRVVIEFNAEKLDGISVKISKAVECPFHLGAETQCARVVDAKSCYCAVLTTRTWQEQNAFCQSNGFSLLALESAEEEKAVTKTWGSIPFWMSLNDRNTEGTWVWDASGATLGSFDYVNWAKGEPNDVKGEEDCVEWKLAGSGWNDNNCKAQIGAICERQPSSSNKVPSSCADLRRAGQSASGLYQVKSISSQRISTVFCDMSKTTESKGFETAIGINDVKSAEIHFSVAKTSSVQCNCTVITYDHEWVNVGNAMNIESGVFTAPKAGIYSFTFNAVGSDGDEGWIEIRRNDNRVAKSWIAAGKTNSSSATAHVILSLNAGDRVDTFSPSAKLYSSNDSYSINFSGSLIAQL